MREVYGNILVKWADIVPELIVLDADVSSSTQTVHFGRKYPARFFNVGVAEANLVDVAGGMATCGLKPVVNAFAVFLSLKATDQIQNVICHNNLQVMLVGSYSGLSDSFDGASHQSITDLAIMHAMPNMSVYVPADTADIEICMKAALNKIGPSYIRLCRNPMPGIPKKIERDPVEKIRVLCAGSDLTVVVCGVLTSLAYNAIQKMQKNSYGADLLNVVCLKPLDKESLINSVVKTKKVLIIQEHSIIGGLTDAVSLALKGVPHIAEYMGIEDTFTETGEYNELLAKYGMSEDNIVKKSIDLINRSVDD